MILNSLLLAWLWANYWLCVLVDPGRVPEGWVSQRRLSHDSCAEQLLPPDT
jgi:hypothetical protein